MARLTLSQVESWSGLVRSLSFPIWDESPHHWQIVPVDVATEIGIISCSALGVELGSEVFLHSLNPV